MPDIAVAIERLVQRKGTFNRKDVVVPFGAGSLRESGGNRRGFGLGGGES